MGLLWLYLSFPLFRLVSENLGRWVWACTLKGFHKNWSESLAKRRLCLGPASVINCTPLSALSFRVSLFPGTRGYNITIGDTEHLFKYLMAMCMPSSWTVHWDLWPISYWVFLWESLLWNIFSYSESCLFLSFRVSFVVKMLLRLITSLWPILILFFATPRYGSKKNLLWFTTKHFLPIFSLRILECPSLHWDL